MVYNEERACKPEHGAEDVLAVLQQTRHIVALKLYFLRIIRLARGKQILADLPAVDVGFIHAEALV